MAKQPTHPRLVADLGGTNLRLAVQREAGSPLADVVAYACADHAGLLQAVHFYLEAVKPPHLAQAAIGVAAPVKGDRVSLVNNPAWDFSIGELKHALRLNRLEVLNDFAALAHGVPLLGATDLKAVAAAPEQAAVLGATRIVVGPGTGLGLAAIATDREGHHLVVGGEGGHSTMAAADPHEADLLRVLRGEFGHVSAERVVSGPGLVNLYRAHCQLSSVEPEPLDAASIVQRARSQQDAACVQTVRCFVGLLGGFVGNQALSFGAQGGVYLAGGVLPHLGDLFDAQLFRRHFEAKGRYRAYLKSIPVWTIIDPCIALRGALAALE